MSVLGWGLGGKVDIEGSLGQAWEVPPIQFYDELEI